MKGDCRPQKPYKKIGSDVIYKLELCEGTFKQLCKFFKVNRISDKHIQILAEFYTNWQNHVCEFPTEPPNDANDLD